MNGDIVGVHHCGISIDGAVAGKIGRTMRHCRGGRPAAYPNKHRN
jgi:hypothetical protein